MSIAAYPEIKETLVNAVIEGNLNNVKGLLDKEGSIDGKILTSEYYNYTLLHLAVKKEKLDIVNYLLSKKASVNIRIQAEILRSTLRANEGYMISQKLLSIKEQTSKP